MREYTLVSYTLDIKRKLEGDSKLVSELMGKLEAICKKHEGYPFKEGLAELGHEDVVPTAENGFKEPPKTQEYARNRTRYLVGTVWVENSVSLFSGTMSTSLVYEPGQDVGSEQDAESEQDVADLLSDFDKVYEKGEKSEDKIKIPDDVGKKV